MTCSVLLHSALQVAGASMGGTPSACLPATSVQMQCHVSLVTVPVRPCTAGDAMLSDYLVPNEMGHKSSCWAFLFDFDKEKAG